MPNKYQIMFRWYIIYLVKGVLIKLFYLHDRHQSSTTSFRSMLSPTQVPNPKAIPMMTKDKITCPFIQFHLNEGEEFQNEVVMSLKTIQYQPIIILEAIASCVAAIVKEFVILKLVNVTPMGLAVRYVTFTCTKCYVISIV